MRNLRQYKIAEHKNTVELFLLLSYWAKISALSDSELEPFPFSPKINFAIRVDES